LSPGQWASDAGERWRHPWSARAQQLRPGLAVARVLRIRSEHAPAGPEVAVRARGEPGRPGRRHPRARRWRRSKPKLPDARLAAWHVWTRQVAARWRRRWPTVRARNRSAGELDPAH